MSLTLRLNILTQKIQPLIEKERRKEQQLEENDRFFKRTNQIMQDFFPEHKWNQLDEKAKLQLENSEEILILTIEYFRWIEKNYDMRGDQMRVLWEQDKSQILKKVKSKMINQIAKS